MLLTEKLLQLVKQRRQQQTAGQQSAWNCFRRHEQAREQLKPSEQEKIKNFDDVLKIVAYKIEIAAFERMKELDGKTSSKLQKTFTSIGG
jgi:fructose-1,6-bisphosphatase